MAKSGRDADQDSFRIDELSEKVERLNKEKKEIQQRIKELEERITGTHSARDEMRYNFIVDKQTTQVQWSRDKDSQGNSILIASSDPGSNASSLLSGFSQIGGGIVKIDQVNQQPQTVIGRNGEIFIIYSSKESSDKIDDNKKPTAQDDVQKVSPPGILKAPSKDNLQAGRPPFLNNDVDEGDQTRSSIPEPLYQDSMAQVYQDDGKRKYGSKDDQDGYGDPDKYNIPTRGHQYREESKIPSSGQNADPENVTPSRAREMSYDIYYPGGGQPNDRDSARKPNDRDSAGQPNDRDSAGQPNDRDVLTISRPTNKPYISYPGAGQANDRGMEAANLPQMIVVAGLPPKDFRRDHSEDKVDCSDEDGVGCQCYQIMKENEEWKTNVTKLLEILVLNAYGNKIPKSLIKALQNPATREEAVKELLNRTIPLTENDHKKRDSSTEINNNKVIKKPPHKNNATSSGLQQTFPQYPPYPPASFESKESSPRNVQNRTASALESPTSNRTSAQSTHQPSTSAKHNQIDIVCPAGSRPIIHIPPVGNPEVTCNVPRPSGSASTPIACCSPNNPCPKHR